MYTKKNILIIGGFTCLFSLIALCLVAANTEPHCKEKAGDKTDFECSDEFKRGCDAAFYIRLEYSVGTTKYVTSHSCPWEGETAAFGLLGLIMVQVCLGFLFFTLRGKDFKVVVLTLTGVIVPILLTTFGLMIRDLKKGFQEKEEAGITEGFRPGSFIVAIIFLFFGLCLFCAAVFFNYKYPGESGSAVNAVKTESNDKTSTTMKLDTTVNTTIKVEKNGNAVKKPAVK